MPVELATDPVGHRHRPRRMRRLRRPLAPGLLRQHLSVRRRVPAPDVRVHDADLVRRPVNVAPAEPEQLGLPESGHGRDKVEDGIDASQLVLEHRVWGCTGGTTPWPR